MRDWEHRQQDVQNLFNPAFCARVLFGSIQEYRKKSGHDFPFPLVYLVLPLVLPSRIRHAISSRKQLMNWAQEHQELLYDFGARAADLVQVTNEAIEFMFQAGLLALTDVGELTSGPSQASLSKSRFTDDEVKDCLKKSEHVGRWFASVGKVETAYICLGVRP